MKQEEARNTAIQKAALKGHQIGNWRETGAGLGGIETAKCKNCKLTVEINYLLRVGYEFSGNALVEPCPPPQGWEKREEIRDLKASLEHYEEEYSIAVTSIEIKKKIIEEIKDRIKELES